jgi:alkylated DNA repair dioxygenase AlkB
MPNGEMQPDRSSGAEPPLPDGFRLVRRWLGAREADPLLDRLAREIPWEDHTFRMGARIIPMPRRIAFYGPFAYRYSGVLHPARPLPPWLADLSARIVATAGHPLNTVLANLYRTGADSVSWHSDDDYPHGSHPAVASLSLGAARQFRIAHKRQRGERFSLALGHGDLLWMEGASQRDYRHALAKTSAAVGPRINLTFRFMSASNDAPGATS